MTEDEWGYHRKHTKYVTYLGECSKMLSGLIKVAGYAPIDPSKISEFVSTNVPAPYVEQVRREMLSLY